MAAIQAALCQSFTSDTTFKKATTPLALPTTKSRDLNECSSQRIDFSHNPNGDVMKKSCLMVLVLALAAFFQLAHAGDVCNCKGYAGPGGPCYDGPGGAAYKGPGGPAYAGPGGPCYPGPGGPAYPGPGGPKYDGPGGPRYDGPGGKAYDGPGGPAYSGPGGACYAGPGGPCYSGPGGDGKSCSSVCK